MERASSLVLRHSRTRCPSMVRVLRVEAGLDRVARVAGRALGQRGQAGLVRPGHRGEGGEGLDRGGRTRAGEGRQPDEERGWRRWLGVACGFSGPPGIGDSPGSVARFYTRLETNRDPDGDLGPPRLELDGVEALEGPLEELLVQRGQGLVEDRLPLDRPRGEVEAPSLDDQGPALPDADLEAEAEVAAPRAPGLPERWWPAAARWRSRARWSRGSPPPRRWPPSGPG